MPYKNDSPIKDEAQLVSQLESLALLTNFAAKTFNQHITAVYWKQTKEHITAKESLLIKPSDTPPLITLKLLTFFLSLQKLETSVEEKVLLNQLFATPKDPDLVTAMVRLRPRLKYKPNGTPIGTRAIQVPHVDESKLLDLRGFTFVHGETVCLYTFADKKQIKVLAIDEQAGIEAIQKLLQIVLPRWILGDAKEHCYIGKFSPNTKKSDVHGVTSKITKIDVNLPDKSIYTVLM